MISRMQTRSQRRALGSFYTPEWIANWMVSRALPGREGDPDSASLRILDPACGDGAFILPILTWIAERRGIAADDASARLSVVREHAFGVDADRQAIDGLHRRVADWVGVKPSNHTDIADVLATNFPCGDALLGNGWTVDRDQNSVSLHLNCAGTASPAEPIDWSTAFPQVAANGGFDVVIGNPPYRRELNAKSDFDRIAESALGQRWRTARMDLWHYFFHQGLDLLKPGGRLSFIVNSYWTGSTAAKPLRERMGAETTLEEVVYFGAVRLFRDVSGRHMIFQLQKTRNNDLGCRVLNLENLSSEQVINSLDPKQQSDSLTPLMMILPQSQIWTMGRTRSDVVAHADNLRSTGVTLGDVFDVRQGMAENPPFVTKAAAAELGDSNLAGQGVFVLTPAEIAALRLSDHELSLLRPYYALSTINRFQIPPQPSHHVLYLTRKTAPFLEDLPVIARHLRRFRGILERRREVRNACIEWWHLHWPRQERLFLAPRVLCIQMGHIPRFAYSEQPTFVGFSLHLIVASSTLPNSMISLPALTAVLNSSRAKQWFTAHAKRRGAHLDISGTVLKRFPLPSRVPGDVESDLDRLARTWPVAEADFPSAEMLLDKLVDQLYCK
jgi:adenine-specific DNA-methyltransferase